MKKKKFGLKKYNDMHDEITVQGKDGTEVTVRDHIPYTEKENMARELSETMIMVHDDSCMYESINFRKTMLFMIAKYYTNINTDNADIDDIADFMINNELDRKIKDVSEYDIKIVEEIYDDIYRAVVTTYDDDKSLTKAIRTSFGFLFTGEDVSESLAKAETVKDTLYNALNALHEKEEQQEKEIDDGMLNIGGNVISFSKKE